MADINKVRDYFKNDRFVKECNIEILSAEKGYCKCKMTVDEKLLNAMDTIHGGAIYTLADFTFAVAANCDGKATVTQNASISYIKAARGEYLLAEAKLINKSRSTCVYEVEITDDKGTVVAFATGNGYIKDIELNF